jgi:DNA polymerase-3 subunit epsilon
MVTDLSNGRHGYSGERPHGGVPLVPSAERTRKQAVALLFLATGVTAAVAAAVVPVLIVGDGEQALVQEEGAVLAGLVAGTVALLWFAVRLCLLRPSERLAADVQVLASAGQGLAGPGVTGSRIEPEDYSDLAPLPDAINALAERLAVTRRDLDHAVADAALRLAEQKGWLALVLRDLDEGVLVCDLRHQVLLHNPAASRLLRPGEDLLPGQALFSLMLAEPVRHALERLIRHGGKGPPQPEASVRFVGGTPDGRVLFDGRMTLIPNDGNGLATAGATATGYVLVFTDATRELAALGRRDALLHAITDELRAPLANLRSVMETLEDCPTLDGEPRAHLEAAMLGECKDLTARLARITEQYQATVAGTWPMSDLRSHTVIDLVSHRVAARGPVTVTPAGLPCLLHGDSFSLVVLLDHLIERVGAVTNATAFDLAADAAARWTYLDLIWTGEPVPNATIDRWKAEPLAASLGGLTVGDVLRHHRSDLWSDGQPDGRARLRLPLPPARQPVVCASGPDSGQIEPGSFSALRQPSPGGDLTARPLQDLHFVVFDIETTGPDPMGGDGIIGIAAVRVVKRCILTGETFQALVNPGRLILPEAIRRHGITEQQLHDRPDITTILPEFKSFAGNAVLVGHHAGLELAFLRQNERACGVCFDNPVLDTRLLSLWLHGPDADHSIAGVARRLGIAAIDRHTALGDCLTTAAVLVAMLELLRDRGLATLGDVLREADTLVVLHGKESLL